MTVQKTFLGAGAAAALGLLAACATAPASTAPMPSLAGVDCFSTSQWQGWSSPVADVVYLRVSNNRIYQLDLKPGTGRIDRGGQFLLNEVRGANRICSANDLDLTIVDPGGFRTPLFPVGIRRLSADEAAALPLGYRP